MFVLSFVLEGSFDDLTLIVTFYFHIDHDYDVLVIS
jgi:hypothetical protein